MSDNKVVPIRQPEIIAEVGGIVDESRITLCVYGEDLDPEALTKLLGVAKSNEERSETISKEIEYETRV